jgi:hypothetical protein
MHEVGIDIVSEGDEPSERFRCIGWFHLLELPIDRFGPIVVRDRDIGVVRFIDSDTNDSVTHLRKVTSVYGYRQD